MGVKPLFTKAQIDQQFKIIRQRHDAAILRMLERIGLQFVIDARSADTYKDQSGNLRSSIGYIILLNGNVVGRDFQLADQGDDKTTGKAKGEAIAAEVAADHKKGWALIVVAGMDYAAAVEDMGYDVLTNSAFQAEAAFLNFQKSINSFKL